MNLFDPFQFRQTFASARSVAVIGNAPTILQYENGAVIDSHDLVVRFNRATTAGHERQIGSRTDILVVNGANSKKLGPPPSETVRPKCLVAFVSPQGVTELQYEPFAEWVGDLPVMVVFGPDITGLETPLRTRALTSGTYFLFMAQRMLSLEKLFITGFTMFGAVAGGTGKYYADSRPGVGDFHDLDAEEPVFAGLLSSYSGKLTMTPEVEALVSRHSGRKGMPRKQSQEATRSIGFRKWVAAGLSWRLMRLAMQLRRVSERAH